MISELKRAKQLLEDGWSGPDVEPYCVIRGEGVMLNWLYSPKSPEPLWLPTKNFHAIDPRSHEVVESFSVIGALLQVGVGFEPWDLFEQVIRPPDGLDLWLRASGRSLSDVLTMFTDAIGRSKKGRAT